MIDPLRLDRCTLGLPPSINPAPRRLSVSPRTTRFSALTDPDPEVASSVNAAFVLNTASMALEPVVTYHGRLGLPETCTWPLFVKAVSPPSNPSIVMALEFVLTSASPSPTNETVTRPLSVQT